MECFRTWDVRNSNPDRKHWGERYIWVLYVEIEDWRFATPNNIHAWLPTTETKKAGHIHVCQYDRLILDFINLLSTVFLRTYLKTRETPYRFLSIQFQMEYNSQNKTSCGSCELFDFWTILTSCSMWMNKSRMAGCWVYCYSSTENCRRCNDIPSVFRFCSVDSIVM